MTTKIKIGYTEQSKCVVADTSVESDTLSAEDVHKLATEVMLKALQEAQMMSMKYK